MARFLFIILIFSTPAILHAQFFVASDLALAQSLTVFADPNSKKIHSDISYTPRFAINILNARDRKINFGLSLYLEKYSVVGGAIDTSTISVSDRHKSSFIYIAPVLDYKFDAKAKWHLLLLPSFGIAVAGTDIWASSSDNAYLSAATGQHSSAQQTSSSAYTNQYAINEPDPHSFVSKTIVRMGFQLQRRVELPDNNLLIATVGYSFMPGTISSAFKSNGYDIDLQPQVFSLGIGYMRECNKKPKPLD